MSPFLKSCIFVCVPLSLLAATINQVFHFGMRPWMFVALSIVAGKFIGGSIFGNEAS